MALCPYPEFIATATTALTLVLTVLEWLIEEGEDDAPPIYPTEVMISIATLLRVMSDEYHMPLVTALRRIFLSLRIQRTELWPQLINNPVELWNLTGETPSSINHIVHRISTDVERYVRDPRNPRQRLIHTRPFALTTRDRILMCLIWLRTYPTFTDLGSRFGVSAPTAAEHVHLILMIILLHYERRYISWHSLQRWNTLRGTLGNDFPDAVALLDATAIRINRPQGNIQRLYYRGDRGYHFINWQVIVDCNGYFTYGQAGFLGHLLCHDAKHWIRLPSISPKA